MVQEVSGGNKWQMLGSELGKGLSEQIPKEVERYRLSQGLRNIQQNPGNQIENLIRLYSTPGATPEMIQTIAPLLQQAAVKQNRQQKGGAGTPRSQPIQGAGQPASFQTYGQGQQPPAQIQQPNQQEQINARNLNQQNINPQTMNLPQQVAGMLQPNQLQTTGQVSPRTSLTSPQAQNAILQPNLNASPEQIQQRAYELENDYGMAPDQAYKEAKLEDATRVANNAEVQALAPRQDAAEQALKTKLDDKIAQKTHMKVSADPNGLFNVLPGEVYNRKLKEAEVLKAQGKTDTEATDIVSDRIERLVKDVDTLASKIGGRNFFGKQPMQLMKDLRTLKKNFKDEGELNLFKEKQMEHLDIGDHQASLNTWEPSKGLDKALIGISVNDTPEQIAAKIYPHITSDDSIFTAGLLLNKLGVDDVAVINELQDLQNNGIFKPDARLTREMSEYYKPGADLGDVLWSSIKEFHPISAAFRYITGQKSKVPAVEKIKRYFGKE